ncbi:unknown [Prevotella sp. CAG:1058]|nr:unknown [Prevotella sp. CAG:1058]
MFCICFQSQAENKRRNMTGILLNADKTNAFRHNLRKGKMAVDGDENGTTDGIQFFITRCLHIKPLIVIFVARLTRLSTLKAWIMTAYQIPQYASRLKMN